MSITKTLFDRTPDGKEVYSYVLDNNKNLRAEILNYGGIIKSLWVKKANGEYVDVVLGSDTLDGYLNNTGYYGAAIGRVANRIYKSKFFIDNTEYNVTPNSNENSLHGGKIGYDSYIWDVTEKGSDDEPSLEMYIVSPDGDEGYPGTLKIIMTYTLTENNGLLIHYEAVSDKDTIVNLTNHSYFNLNGLNSGNIHNHYMQMNCDFFTPNTDECMPYGEILSVKDTPFDFTSGKLIGDGINGDHKQIQMFCGYDHNFVIRGTGFRKACVVSSDETGIAMEVYTDKPGVQLYTGNSIVEGEISKNGKTFRPHDALCLETQYFPNSITYPHYPSPILRAGKKYDFKTEYKFIVK